MLNAIFLQAPLFLLIFVRCLAMLMTLPLLSMRAVSRVAKVALAGYLAFFMLNTVNLTEYYSFLSEDGIFSLEFVLLAAGETLIGIILGFYVSIIFSAFSTAGQFIAFQMGLGAASAYDSLSQIENPLMGQFFNLVAMLVFMQTKWFQFLFINGLTKSFSSITAITIANCQDAFLAFFFRSLTDLFADAFVIALPIIGSLFLITICTGLLTKAAPQMNLLSEGFPIMILLAFYLISVLMPQMVDFFISSFEKGFQVMQNLFIEVNRIQGR